jgi:hypothetical protein
VVIVPFQDTGVCTIPDCVLVTFLSILLYKCLKFRKYSPLHTCRRVMWVSTLPSFVFQICGTELIFCGWTARRGSNYAKYTFPNKAPDSFFPSSRIFKFYVFLKEVFTFNKMQHTKYSLVRFDKYIHPSNYHPQSPHRMFSLPAMAPPAPGTHGFL